MIYVNLGLFIAALWGVSLIAFFRSEELSTGERCDLLSEFGNHFQWIEAIGQLPANELNKICSTSRRSKEMTDDVTNQKIEYSPYRGHVASLIPGEDLFSGTYAI